MQTATRLGHPSSACINVQEPARKTCDLYPPQAIAVEPPRLRALVTWGTASTTSGTSRSTDKVSFTISTASSTAPVLGTRLGLPFLTPEGFTCEARSAASRKRVNEKSSLISDNVPRYAGFNGLLGFLIAFGDMSPRLFAFRSQPLDAPVPPALPSISLLLSASTTPRAPVVR
jgi:hypothetical protein